jgi:hypothetical protein
MSVINSSKISDRVLNEYMKDGARRFCQDCRNLSDISEMYVQLYVNGLYGYTCDQCAKPKT